MALVRKVFKTWKEDEIDAACRLYLITDDAWLDGRTLGSCVAEAIVGGVTMVQLRNKKSVNFELVKQARALAPICHIANIPLIINDDLEAAKITGADGLHIGQRDISCAEARSVLGADAIVGVSASNVNEAIAAQKDGASYLIAGPIFNGYRDDSAERSEARPIIGVSILEDICSAVEIPVIASGGVTIENIPELSGTRATGVASVSSILGVPDIEQAAREMLNEVDAHLSA